MDRRITGTIRRKKKAGIVLKTARRYGDEIMKKLMGLNITDALTSNFQNIALFTERGGFGAVSQFQKLDRAALVRLVNMQPQDAATLNRKMTFLCGERTTTPDRPYWTRGGDWKDLYSGANLSILFEFGTIVFGGQVVQVEATNGIPHEFKFWGQYQNTPNAEWITFYKLVGLRKTDTRPVADLMAEGLVQRGTWAGSNNSYHDTWDSGIVLHPVWSELDYPCNNGALYLAKAFCL
jgi:hypothetical protein